VAVPLVVSFDDEEASPWVSSIGTSATWSARWTRSPVHVARRAKTRPSEPSVSIGRLLMWLC
jgi:hypothetical protein